MTVMGGNCRGPAASHRAPAPPESKKIFVGGLATSVTEDAFRDYFQKFGNVTDAVVMMDRNTQRSRGFGFITFDSEVRGYASPDVLPGVGLMCRCCRPGCPPLSERGP